MRIQTIKKTKIQNKKLDIKLAAAQTKFGENI